MVFYESLGGDWKLEVKNKQELKSLPLMHVIGCRQQEENAIC